MKSKIRWFEPLIFEAFGVFHLHRIWALIDRKSYAAFWIGFMEHKGAPYYLLMCLLLVLCIAGITVLVKEIGHNYWWRYIYVLGGGYVIWDLISQLFQATLVERLLQAMFDIKNPYWNIIWSAFVVMGALSFILGILLELRRRH